MIAAPQAVSESHTTRRRETARDVDGHHVEAVGAGAQKGEYRPARFGSPPVGRSAPGPSRRSEPGRGRWPPRGCGEAPLRGTYLRRSPYEADSPLVLESVIADGQRRPVGGVRSSCDRPCSERPKRPMPGQPGSRVRAGARSASGWSIRSASTRATATFRPRSAENTPPAIASISLPWRTVTSVPRAGISSGASRCHCPSAGSYVWWWSWPPRRRRRPRRCARRHAGVTCARLERRLDDLPAGVGVLGVVPLDRVEGHEVVVDDVHAADRVQLAVQGGHLEQGAAEVLELGDLVPPSRSRIRVVRPDASDRVPVAGPAAGVDPVADSRRAEPADLHRERRLE